MTDDDPRRRSEVLRSSRFGEQKYTELQMAGMHLRKVLVALVRLRRDRWVPLGDAAGATAIAVEMLAAIRGSDLTERMVENACVGRLNFEPDRTIIGRLVAKARREIASGEFALMPPKLIGKLLDFTAEEKWTIAAMYRLKKIFIEPIDHAEDVKRRRRESAARRRAVEGKRARWESAAAAMARLGTTRYALYEHGKRDPQTLLWTIPMERRSATPEAQKIQTKTWTIPGVQTNRVDDPLSTEIVHKSVSPGAASTDLKTTKKRTA